MHACAHLPLLYSASKMQATKLPSPFIRLSKYISFIFIICFPLVFVFADVLILRPSVVIV